MSAAYQLPKDTHGQKEARSAAIAEALGGAARPPADVIRLARRLIELAEQLLPAGNRNVITDVAAAAEAARAAAVTARLNIEVNLHGVKDATLRDELTATAAVTDEIIARADQIVAAVRKEIARIYTVMRERELGIITLIEDGGEPDELAENENEVAEEAAK